MLVARKSPIDGKTRVWEITVTDEQLSRWNRGELIQNCMPTLDPNQREFMMTGITPQQWDEMFGVDGDREPYNDEALGIKVVA